MGNEESIIEVHQSAAYVKWFRKLGDRNARARINFRIKRLELGNQGDAKPVGGGVWELQIYYGPGYRVYYSRPKPELTVLLTAGKKSSQQQDIRKARNLVQGHGREKSDE